MEIVASAADNRIVKKRVGLIKKFTDIMTKAIYDKTGLGEIMNYLERSRR